MDEPKVSVSGDAVGGWHVDVHDNVTHDTYSPVAASAGEAATKALAEHVAKYAVPETLDARLKVVEAEVARIGAALAEMSKPANTAAGPGPAPKAT